MTTYFGNTGMTQFRSIMRWWNIALLVVGVLLALLGSLWLLQGADLVHVRPILCVTNCQPVMGGSPAWLITGVVTAVVGILCVGASLRYRIRPA
jgi:hypothetical protein